MILMIGILSFSLFAFGFSWAVGKRGKVIDSGELSFSVIVIAWGAMLYGMYIARY
jgi:hypothetical protein